MDFLLLAVPALISVPGGPVKLLPGELEGVCLRMTLDEVLAVIKARKGGAVPQVDQEGRTFRLARIIATFDADSFTAISVALARRYGASTRQVAPFDGKEGPGLRSASFAWKVQDGQILLDERKPTRDLGRLDLVSTSLWPLFQASLAHQDCSPP